MKTLKTAHEVKTELLRKGMPIAWWADLNKIPRSVVYGLLAGRITGDYGNAHKAAVLLGLKDGEIVQ